MKGKRNLAAFMVLMILLLAAITSLWIFFHKDSVQDKTFSGAKYVFAWEMKVNVL